MEATTERFDFVESVLLTRDRLIASWDTKRGIRVFQEWKRKVVILFQDSSPTNWEDCPRAFSWEMQHPYILAGVDPEVLITWAKVSGRYEKNEG